MKEQKCHFLQEEYLKSINKDKLSDLLSHEPSNLIQNSEQLLAIAEQLSKEWKSYITKTLRPAIMSALTTSDKQFIGPLSDKRLDALFDGESYYWKLADNYYEVSVLPSYLTTEATLLNGNTPDGAWRNMFNVATDLPNKGLFRQFIRTKSNGYLDMTNEAKTSMYNINTGFTFTLHSPVEVNGIPFIPINNWTLFQYD